MKIIRFGMFKRVNGTCLSGCRQEFFTHILCYRVYFSGVLFPIRIKEDLPVSKIVLYSVAVRGRLGPMTVWVSNEDAPTGTPGHRGDAATNNNNNEPDGNGPPRRGGNFHFRLRRRDWTKVYEQVHAPSVRQYQKLDFSDNPVILKPGTVRAIYIHSKLPGDEAIVYDNTRHNFQPFGGGGHWGRRPMAMSRRHEPNASRYQDDMIAIYTGKAHLSTVPFGQTNIWGWDNAWRDYREFVGQLHYGTVFQLWQPSVHVQFGSLFDKCARTLFGLQRRWDSPISMLPDECIFYILNMCRWDWFEDKSSELKEKRRQREARLRAIDQQRQEETQEAQQQREDTQVTNYHAQQPVTEQVTTSTMDRPCTNRENAIPVAASSSSSCALQQERAVDDSEFFDAQQEMSEAQNASPETERMETSSRTLGLDAGANDDGDEEEDDDEDYNASDDDAMMDEDEELEEEDQDQEDDEEDDEENEIDMDGSQPDEDDDDDDDDEWDRANGYRANPSFLTLRYASSDEEDEAVDDEDVDEEEEQESRHAWFRRHFARIHILRALAQAENETDDDRVVIMHLD